VSALPVACGAFLLAVLWFDLMFDVQVLRYRAAALVPEETLASIAAYYRRVTTDASPMGRAVGLVMLVGFLALVVQLVRGAPPARTVTLASLALYAAPVALAGARVVPNAVRRGARRDPPEVQSALARGICRDHLACLAGIAAFVALQLLAAR
jgi:hypothetical protein